MFIMSGIDFYQGYRAAAESTTAMMRAGNNYTIELIHFFNFSSVSGFFSYP